MDACVQPQHPNYQASHLSNRAEKKPDQIDDTHLDNNVVVLTSLNNFGWLVFGSEIVLKKKTHTKWGRMAQKVSNKKKSEGEKKKREEIRKAIT